MKTRNMPRLINHQDNIKKLIIHFNINKTIIIRDSLSYDNSDVIVSIIILLIELISFKYITDKKCFIGINLGKRRQK